jgi:hypothetical protein
MNLQTLKNLPRKIWLIIVASVTVVLAGIIIYFLAGSLYRLGDDPGVPGFMRRTGDESSLFAQIAAKEVEIAAQNAIAAKLPERQALLDSMKADIAAARKRLPTDAQKAEVRQLIEDLARQVGSASGALVVRSVAIREAAPTTGRAAAAGDYKSVEYQTAVTADMDGIIQYINLIERNERFMTVEGIQLTTGGVAFNLETNKVEPKPHTAQLRIVTYIDSTSAQPGRRN